MKIYNQEDVKINGREIIDSIRKGKLLIYPTDTIYGIGCNAQNPKSVKKIRELKERPTNPFSVIAPSIEWIRTNCQIDYEAEEWIKKLPGPYTFIMKLKNKDCISKEVNCGIETIGIRLPNHWISKLVANTKLALVTTSVNKSGQDFMTSLEDLDDSIKHGIDIMIYEGEKKGKPSKIVDLTGNARRVGR